VCVQQKRLADFLEQLMTMHVSHKEKVVSEFLVGSFIYSLDNDRFDLAVMVHNQYQVKLYDDNEACINALIRALERSDYYFEYKLYFVQCFLLSSNTSTSTSWYLCLKNG